MKPVCTTADYQLQKSCIPARKVSHIEKRSRWAICNRPMCWGFEILPRTKM